MTQVKLAAGLGVTFQQVQKYENGVSPITADRLQHAAEVLQIPVSFFFPKPEPSPRKGGPSPSQTTSAELMAFLATTEGVELGKAFADVDPALRRRILDLIRTISASTRTDEA